SAKPAGNARGSSLSQPPSSQGRNRPNRPNRPRACATLVVRGPKRAEPVVRLLAAHKADVLAALALTDQDQSAAMAEAQLWRGRFAGLAFAWSRGGDRDWNAARRLAWGDLQNEWHRLYGKRWPTWRCAGCDAPIGGLEALSLPDGNRVHLNPIDCLIR